MANPGNDKPKTSSASGERRALTGFRPQYQIAAALVLNALRRRQLRFIELGNDANGAVDDIVIASAVRIDAYQVKWGEYPDTFTMNDLVKVNKNGRTIIQDLFEGQRLLRNRYPERLAEVHLYTCDYPSNNDDCRAPDDEGKLSFTAFIATVWNPLRSGDESVIKAEPHAWKKLVSASGASEVEFLSFVKHCHLDFGAKLPGAASNATRDETLERDQHLELSQKLVDLALDPEKKHHFERADLLQRLGWDHYFSLRNRHDFSVTRSYEEISATAAKLNSVLDAIPGEYVLVDGSPGSGKSSLLTRTSERRSAKERWIKYYAFIPGTAEPGNTRGESENFLHDLTNELEEAGVMAGGSRSNFDRQQLLLRMNAQLLLLGKEFKENNRRTVILIDGLDHIPREQDPQRSMLKDLPFPDRVPDGVIILLGSQTDQLKDIPVAIKTVLSDPARRVLMEPLAPVDAEKVIDASELPIPLNADQRSSVHRLSQGHPLALGLLLNHIAGASTSDEIKAILSSTIVYDGQIDALYAAHWDPVAEDDELINVLALIGRLRRPIDLAWLHDHFTPAVLKKIKGQLRHLFTRENEQRWFFFHNSFRLFIQKRTEQLVAATREENEKELHRQLADLCSKSQDRLLWFWETGYHLGESGQHVAVIALAVPQHFRAQLLAFRPVDAIAIDIRHAMRSAKATSDVLAAVRLVLLSAEFAQRASHLNSYEVAQVLLRLRQVDLAIEHLFDGCELRVSSKEAMASSRRLKAIDRTSEAERLFERGEPLSAATQLDAGSAAERRELLQSWVKASVSFRPIDEICAFIDSITVLPDHLGETSADDAAADLKANLFFSLAQRLYRDGRDKEADLVAVKLCNTRHERGFWFWLQCNRWRQAEVDGDKQQSVSLIKETLTRIPFDSLDNGERSYVVDGFFRAEGLSAEVVGMARQLIQPHPVKEYLHSEDGLHHFLERFRVNRILYACGAAIDATEIVPSTSEFENQGNVLFERAIVRVARLWGDAWKGKKVSSHDIKQQLTGFMRIYDRSDTERHRWRSWHSIVQAAEQFYDLIISGVELHGDEALNTAREMFAAEWIHPDRKTIWSASLKRSLIMSFCQRDGDRVWAVKQLGVIETSMLDGEDISGRVEECRKQSLAWARLGDEEQSIRWLQKMSETSFGVGYRKDYQLDHVMEWLPFVNEVDPNGAGKRFAWFAAASRQLDDSTEGRSSRTAATALVSFAAAWSPRRSVTLLQWFLENGPIGYEEGCEKIFETLLNGGSLSVLAAKAMLFEFLFRFAKTPSSAIAMKVVVAAKKADAIDGAQAVAIEGYEALSRYSIPSSRRGWLKGLHDGLAAAGTPKPAELPPVEIDEKNPSSGGSSEYTVRLKDGTELTGEEIVERTSTVDALILLTQESTDRSFIKWADHIEKLAAVASVQDVVRLADAAHALKSEPLTLALLSRRLTALSRKDLAWTVGLRALERSSFYGWVEWGDGGTRLFALQALVEADPEHGRPLAFQTFVDDMMQKRSDPYSVVHSLHKIVRLFPGDLPLLALWNEIDPYLKALCPGLEFAIQPDFSGTIANDTPDHAVIDFLSLHLPNPVDILRYGSQHAMAALLRDGHGDAIENTKACLGEERDEVVMSTLGVMEGLAEESVEYVTPFADQLVKLAGHQSFVIWFGARDLLRKLGVDPLPQRPRRALPPIYSLELPDSPVSTLIHTSEPSTTTPIRDMPGYLNPLIPFDSELRWVAKMIGAPAANVLHRARAIMSELFNEEDWSSAAEKRLRKMLSDASLEFGFHRPGAALARIAVFRTLSELFDAGVIPEDRARFIFTCLKPFDPKLIVRKASRRPIETLPISGLTEHGHGTKEWVLACKDDRSRVLGTVGGQAVLGELTRLKRLPWETPTITIRSACAVEKRHANDDLWKSYPKIIVSTYPELAVVDDDNGLVIHKQFDGRDSDPAEWIAFNPYFALKLGWTFSPTGFCKWTDASGETMAETLWWKDSTLDHRPPQFDDEVGEGWLVVLSADGVKQLRSSFPTLFRRTLIERNVYLEREQKEESATFDDKI